MNRFAYFDNLKQVESPLQLIPCDWDALRLAAAEGSVDPLLAFADELAEVDSIAAKTRAAFIRLQCAELDTEDLFAEYSETWGIPSFEEDILGVQDFRNGFLWTFRDHSSSWSEAEEAREWFYTHVEARFARRYEFWAKDHGPEEMIVLESGEYKKMLWSIITKHVDYSPFISPVFTREELKLFFNNFKEHEYEFEKDSLLAIMKQNANW